MPLIGASGGGGGKLGKIHSQVAKIEVITQQILEINTRGDSRINEGKSCFRRINATILYRGG